MSAEIQRLKIKFVAKLGAMGTYSDGEEKFHVMIPKQYISNEIRNLKGKQVKITLEDEI
jgi:hypothetical protein